MPVTRTTRRTAKLAENVNSVSENVVPVSRKKTKSDRSNGTETNDVLKEKNQNVLENFAPVKNRRRNKEDDANLPDTAVTTKKTNKRDKKKLTEKIDCVVEETKPLEEKKKKYDRRRRNLTEVNKECDLQNDAPVDDNEPDAEDIKRTNRRGRKITEKNDSNQIEQKLSQEPAEVAVPPKKGKKYQQKAKIEAIKNSEPIKVDTAPKKRGRKAKPPLENPSDIIEQPEDDQSKDGNSFLSESKNDKKNRKRASATEIKDLSIIKRDTKIDNVLNETYDVLQQKSVMDFGMSNIEDIEMPSLIRDDTFIKNSTMNMSREGTFTLDTSKKKTLAAASPCKLFADKKSSVSSAMKTPMKSFCRAISVGSAGCTPMPRKKPSEVKTTPLTAASPCKLFADKKSSVSSAMKTPMKSFCRAISVGSAGCTPMPRKKPSEVKTTPLTAAPQFNRTRSIEKPDIKTVPKVSKVFFKSPDGKSSEIGHLNSSKLIKSSLKGSNKSFVHTISETHNSSRKRSLLMEENEVKSPKIRKLTADNLNSVKRPLKPKTEPGCTPAKPKLTRGKMPNFASVHKKQFDQMESLVDCKARKEERAKLLLSAGKGTFTFTGRTDQDAANSTDATSKNNGSQFNRFGFKLNIVAPVENRKSASSTKIKMNKSKAEDMVTRQEQKRSSFVERNRNANKEYIKGVRTNRRFELQMKNRLLSND